MLGLLVFIKLVTPPIVAIPVDALVLSRLQPAPHIYANSLLRAVGFLPYPALRPPAMASEINSGGHLERRFRMIASGTLNRTNSRWMQACVLLCAAVVLPLGVSPRLRTTRPSARGLRKRSRQAN